MSKSKILNETIGRWAEEVEVLSKPFDPADLEKAGIITKKGEWYVVRNIHDIPDAAARRISSCKMTQNGTRIKFMKESTIRRLTKGKK